MPTPIPAPKTVHPDDAPCLAGRLVAGLSVVALALTAVVALPTAIVLGVLHAPIAAWRWAKKRNGRAP